MSKNDIAILQTRETIFCSHEDGKLRQLIIVTIEDRLEQSLQGAVVVIKAGGEEVITKLGETYPFDAIALVGCYEKKKIPLISFD